MSIEASLNVLLLAVVAGLGWTIRNYRRRMRYIQGRDMGWAIPESSLEDFSDAFARDALGPIPARSEVAFLGGGDGIEASTSDLEAYILAVLSRKASCMFEVGTCTGRTAYLWARNSATDAKVITLTLAPDQLDLYRAQAGDAEKATEGALRESCHTQFIYSGTDVAHKVVQLFGDSAAFDETPYLGQCDLVFVDGSHAYSYAKNDTEKALRMLKPGGIILWHDYNQLKGRATIGVTKYLDELAQTLPLVRLRRTSLVAYRAPSQPVRISSGASRAGQDGAPLES